jgi:DivIVA domain-containing protein
MIDLTPLEVRKKKGDFRRALRGYEPEQVDDFLDIVADRLEQLVRENAELHERAKRLEHGVAEYRDRERALTDALVTAQEMREEIKSQTTREAELLRRSSQEEATTRVRDAEQQAETAVRDAERRAETLVHDAETLVHDAETRSTALLNDAEQRSATLLREAEQRAATLLREAEQRVELLVREAEQQSEDRVRKAGQEAETQVRQAERESQQLRAGAKRERDREESAMRRLRARQEQLLASYRTFLERELAELSAITSALEPLDGAETDAAAVAVEEPQPRETAADLPPAPPSFAAAVGLLAEFDEEELEPFEPEPVYEEDLEKDRVVRVEPTTLPREPAPEVVAEAGEPTASGWPELEVRPEFRPVTPAPEAAPATPDTADVTEDVDADEAEADAETEALLENAKRAGYRIELDEDELLLEEPAPEDEGDDWLNSMIEETK